MFQDTHEDSDEYSIVAFCKNATIIIVSSEPTSIVKVVEVFDYLDLTRYSV